VKFTGHQPNNKHLLRARLCHFRTTWPFGIVQDVLVERRAVSRIGTGHPQVSECPVPDFYPLTTVIPDALPFCPKLTCAMYVAMSASRGQADSGWAPFDFSF